MAKRYKKKVRSLNKTLLSSGDVVPISTDVVLLREALATLPEERTEEMRALVARRDEEVACMSEATGLNREQSEILHDAGIRPVG